MNANQAKLIKAFSSMYGKESLAGEGKKHSTTDIIVLVYVALSEGKWAEHSQMRRSLQGVCTPGAMSKSIERLQDSGFIVAADSPTGDSRMKIARLTEAGSKQYQLLKDAMG